jgi:hypothetical protein
MGVRHAKDIPNSYNTATSRLTTAVVLGNQENVLEAINDGADVNTLRGLPLKLALEYERYSIITTLLLNDADVSVLPRPWTQEVNLCITSVEELNIRELELL